MLLVVEQAHHAQFQRPGTGTAFHLLSRSSSLHCSRFTWIKALKSPIIFRSVLSYSHSFVTPFSPSLLPARARSDTKPLGTRPKQDCFTLFPTRYFSSFGLELSRCRCSGRAFCSCHVSCRQSSRKEAACSEHNRGETAPDFTICLLLLLLFFADSTIRHHLRLPVSLHKHQVWRVSRTGPVY